MHVHAKLRSFAAALGIVAWMSLQPVPASEGAPRAIPEANPAAIPAVLRVEFAPAAFPIAPAALASDCNDNGVEDAVDIAVGYSSDVDGNGIPDECDARGR